jgi:hypothetical protein
LHLRRLTGDQGVLSYCSVHRSVTETRRFLVVLRLLDSLAPGVQAINDLAGYA